VSYNPHQACVSCGSPLHAVCARGEQELTPDELEAMRLRGEVRRLETEAAGWKARAETSEALLKDWLELAAELLMEEK